MQKKWNGKKLMGVTGALALLLLAGCGNEAATQAPGIIHEDGVIDVHQFSPIKTNVGEAIEGGVLNFGIVAGSGFLGVLNPVFTNMNLDMLVSQWFNEPLVSVDENFIMNQNGAATWTIEDGRIFTFTINDNVYWSDGEPVTAQDWVFTHEVLASPEYTEAGGVRFANSLTNIAGIMDFHNGDADYISGLRIIDDRTLVMEFVEASPSLFTGGVWAEVIPYHLFKDIPVSEMQDHPLSRVNPIGFGPFILESIVPGESAMFVRNENYWRGAPVLDGVNVSTVNPELVAQELRNGNIDVVSDFPAAQVIEQVDLNNVEWLAQANPSYRYIGFNLGTFDREAVEVVPNPDSRVGDVRLRQAMWHALDTEAIGRLMFNGLGRPAGGLITPSHALWYSGIDRPAFSVDIANELLDEAGFAWDANNEWRLDQDGNEFVLNFFWNPTDNARESQILFFVQSWAEVGLNVNAVANEAGTHFDLIQTDYDGIDLFYAGWSLGWDVDRSQTYGRYSAHNFSRYASEENDRLINISNSVEAMDNDFRRAAFVEWQEYMLEQVPVFPILYTYAPLPFNNRVHNWRIDMPIHSFLSEVALSAESPIEHN